MDPYLLYLLVALFGAIAAILLFLSGSLVLHKRYGATPPPDAIRSLGEEILQHPVRADLTGFALHQEKQERRCYRRFYFSPDGIWDFYLEMDHDVAIAFRALLRHKHCFLMNTVYEGHCQPPRILLPTGL